MAAITRTSTSTAESAPIRITEPVSRTRRSFTWSSIGISVISSRKRVPLWARSKYPLCRRSAPVKLPLSWPKSSLSIRVGETAPQLSGRKGAFERRDRRWIVCAARSLPVPLSPIRRTEASVGATRLSIS